MKILRSVLLVAALSVGACYAQAPAPEVKAVRSFDVASCAPDGFIAAHIEISKDALTVLKIVPGPGIVNPVSPPNVYKLVAKDKDGKHYAAGDFEIVVKTIKDDGTLLGILKLKGKDVALFYGIESDGSDSKLLTNANEEHEVCIELLKDADDNAPKKQVAPVVENDTSSKI